MNTNDLRFPDGVRQLYVPRLNTVSKSFPDGLRGLLHTSEDFIPVGLNQGGCFELIFYDISEALAALAGDINRLACASIETLNAISEIPTQKRFLAWQLVEYYYAAFYSAHCMLKICGFGTIQLDDRIIQSIKKRALLFGEELPTITKGIYCADIRPIESKIVFYDVSRYDDSHHGLWNRYVDFLNVLTGMSISTNSLDSNCIRKRESAEPYPQSVYSQLPRQDADQIIGRVDHVKAVLNTKGNNNWLSQIRNSINYNHSHGVWYPYKGYSDEYEMLVYMRSMYSINSLNKCFLTTEGELELVRYAKCCQQINAFNRELIIDLSIRHPDNKSFLKNGPLAYLNLYA